MINDKEFQEPASDCSIEKKVSVNEEVIETVKDITVDDPSPAITEQPMSETSMDILYNLQN
jgi:hypothetical protein